MITNPTALITGGAHGIGLGIAMQLASEGYALALMGRSDKKHVLENLDQVKSFGVPVIYFSGNTAEDASRQASGLTKN